MKTINSLRSKLLALTLALMASVASFAYEFEYVNDFHIDGFGYKIISVNTPDDGEGYVSLIEIADCKKDVVIPKYVSYGDRGFHVTTFGVGSVVFTNDASSVVESITIPKTTSVINKNALAGCPNLKTVVVDSENPYYDSRENCNAIITTSQNPYFTPNTLIAGCKTTIIPNSVAEIGDNAFYNSALESITIPTGTTKIGRSAFNNSILLSSITLSATLIEISDWAFADCLSLNTIICYAIEPPTISSNTFFGSNPIYNNPTIYVPAESVDAYKNADQWKDFGQILPIEPTSYKSQWCDTWNVMEHDMGMIFDTEKTWRHYLAQDTIINEQTYTYVNYYWTLEESKVYRIALVRFTEDQKVYALLGDTEYLVYDFSVQVGDTIETIVGVNCGTMLQQLLVHQVDIDDATNRKTITLYPLCKLEEDVDCDHCDENGHYLWECCPIEWIEGVGSTEGFLMGYPPCGHVGGIGHKLLCAYKDDELQYINDLYQDDYGCEYNAVGQNPEDLFPTLWGLQRTHTIEMYDHAPNDGKRSGGYPLPFASVKDTVINGKTYLQFGDYVNGSNYSLFFLREENNKVLIYSSILQNDLVLYDYTLELGDSLPAITSDHDYFSDDHFTKLDKAENIFTYVVTDVSTITLLDGIERKKWTLQNQYLGIMEYVEGIGCFGEKNSDSGDFFRLIENHPYVTESIGNLLVCVSQNGQLLYSMSQEEMDGFTLTCECLSQEDTIAPKDLFPTLWGLQRTSCSEYVDCQENETYLMQADEIKEINGKQYLKYGGVFLREEDSKVLIYSFPYEKDFVLYDWTLGIGDTLQILGIDPFSFPELEYTAVVDYVAFEEYDANGNRTIVKKPLGNKRVKDISTMRLLDGNEYKAWLFGYDWERGNYYVEGIGNASKYGGDYVDLVCPFGVPSCYYGERLVCVSRDGILLYQIDDAEMERLGTECLCEYNSGPKKDNAKNGKIGGRPTPTQWNMLEVETKEIDGTPTILRAETFSYTLENDSIVTKGKTFYQLARQSTKDTAITKSFVGALHFGEDEDNRVYFLRDGVEYVLYDFTAEPGDTIEIFAGINNYPHDSVYTHVVTGKDTLENGACRMLLEVVFPEETNATATHAEKIWLAGLGSVDGIVHNAAKRTSNAHAAPSRSAHSSETESSVMLCAWREDSCLYTTNHPDYETFGCVYNQDPTAVESPTSSSSYQKVLRGGQLLIMHNGKTYTVMGIEMK